MYKHNLLESKMMEEGDKQSELCPQKPTGGSATSRSTSELAFHHPKERTLQKNLAECEENVHHIGKGHG